MQRPMTQIPPFIIHDSGQTKYYCATSGKHYIPQRIRRGSAITWCVCTECDAYRRLRDEADYNAAEPQEHGYLNSELHDEAVPQS